jgi:pyruvate-formate lyase-activating enzyme
VRATLAYTDTRGRVFFDESRAPLADGGIVRAPLREELIPIPDGGVVTMLPGRSPRLAGGGAAARRTALGVLLPAGYTRTLLPAYEKRAGAPELPLFGYTFACAVDDELMVAAMRTDESEDWQPRREHRFEPDVADLVRLGVHHLERVDDGIVSFGQGCEGEPLLRSIEIARAITGMRAARGNGTINCNTNGSMPAGLQRLIDAGLQAVRVSLNSFRPDVYAAYYRPTGYTLDDVLASVALAVRSGLRVSLNLLTHPGVTDDRAEVEAAEAFLRAHPVSLVQTRTLNIDPDVYFARVGRPAEPLGMREALERIRRVGIALGNFTHTH